MNKQRIASISKFTTIFFLLVLIIIFSTSTIGCSKKQVAPDPVECIDNSFQRDELDTNAKFNEQLFASANLNPDRGDYLLGAGDLLEVKVFEAEKLNATVRVSSRGQISLPLLGEISVKGLSAWDVEKLIEEKFQSTYIKDPHVSIFVQEHFSQRVTIVGEVKSPGTYDFPARQRLMDAIALAGGLTEKAGQIAQVRRNSSSLQDANTEFIVDLDELMKDGKTELNISINGGDVIFIAEAGAIFIDGAVRRPGRYQINKSMTLMEAILTAGGFESYANMEEVVLSREGENGARNKLELNLEEDSDNVVASQQLKLKDRDIIIVDMSFWGKFRGLGLNVGTGGVGVILRDPDY